LTTHSRLPGLARRGRSLALASGGGTIGATPPGSAPADAKRHNRHGFFHPCRCLCRGSAQTTKTTPRRRTILHLSHMRRTLARTFMDELANNGLGGL